MFQIFKNNFLNNIMLEIEYIIILLIALVGCYFIFFKKETFINRKLEKFNGDDLNVHDSGDYNINTNNNTDIIE